ncbi:MAG: hypothetical protein KAG97_11850, partial [Victivallales bacterium]|nr:hypothetical protein [Victivallales bacterium]
LLTEVIDKDVNALLAAEELETALLNQKGFVTYYFLDGDPNWLEQLEFHRRAFAKWLGQARESARGERETKILDRIETEHSNYVESKNRVIELYKSGDRADGAKLHWEVRDKFFVIYDLCEEYKTIHKERITRASSDCRNHANRVSFLAITFMSASVLLGVLLAFILLAQIIIPIRKLTVRTATPDGTRKPGNEVATLSRQVNGLVDDIHTTLQELDQSHERLVHSEKMANLGKLAAEAAHSIRNPMTSIKMRLFSLERNLEMSEIQKEDFEVVAEEMRRLDNIVANFLDFSRPPKLSMQRIHVSDLLDMTLNLLRHRLQLKEVVLERKSRKVLPEVDADPELLKEVFMNLIGNACEAMSEGGRLTVSEEEAVSDQIGRAVMIKIS